MVRLDASSPLPIEWASGSDLLAFIRSSEELTVICDEGCVPPGNIIEAGWRAFKVQGPLPFDQVGVLASLSMALAQAKISVFVISTYDTDYLLIKNPYIQDAIQVWENAGHKVITHA